MIRGKTSTGFKFAVNENIANDFRFIQAFRKTKSKNADDQLVGTYDLVELVIGSANMENLFKHVEDKDGTVSTEKIMNELTEILKIIPEKSKPLKN